MKPIQKYFSVDRRGYYAEGNRIDLEPNPDPQGNEIIAHVNKMYPSGFSRHGVQYLRNPPAPAWTPIDHQSAHLELLLEACRKSHFPHKPCRYQSMFACETIGEALQFRASHGMATDPVFEVMPQSGAHRGDMAILALSSSAAAQDHRLHLYWEGKTLDIPGYVARWEYVLPLPVLVGKRVE